MATLAFENPLGLAMNDDVEASDGRVAGRAHAHTVHRIDADGDGLQPSSALDRVADHGVAEADFGALHS